MARGTLYVCTKSFGSFKTPEEIKLVDGIDDKRWDQWNFEG